MEYKKEEDTCMDAAQKHSDFSNWADDFYDGLVKKDIT